MTGNRLENSRKREGDGLKLMCLFAAAGAQQHSWWVNAILSPQCRKRYSRYSLSPAIKIANAATGDCNFFLLFSFRRSYKASEENLELGEGNVALNLCHSISGYFCDNNILNNITK